MMWRLKELPIYSSFPTTVEAGHYNQIRLALRRLSGPIRLELINHRNVDLLIDDDSWVCVDRNMGDMPIVAWTDFETQDRSALHAPVTCNLHYYHAAAAVVARDALPLAYEMLGVRMKGIKPRPCAKQG